MFSTTGKVSDVWTVKYLALPTSRVRTPPPIQVYLSYPFHFYFAQKAHAAQTCIEIESVNTENEIFIVAPTP